MPRFLGKIFRNSSEKNKIVRSLPKSSYEGKIISDKKKRGHAMAGGSVFLKIFTWLLIPGFVGVVGYILFFSPFMAIDEISIKGEENLKSEDVLVVVKESLAGKYLNVWQKNNFILASKSRIRNDLQGRFKRIENVEVTKSFPNKLSVVIKEVRANLVFCSGDSCWVIDEKGEVFARADFSSNEFGEQDLIVLRNSSAKNIAQEDILIEEDLMKFLIDTSHRLENELNIQIKGEYSTPAMISGDLRVETSEGWKIFFNNNLGSKKTLGMLKAILENNIDQDKRANLEYIDLRVNNKAYYKLKKTEESVDSENKEAKVKEND